MVPGRFHDDGPQIVACIDPQLPEDHGGIAPHVVLVRVSVGENHLLQPGQVPGIEDERVG